MSGGDLIMHGTIEERREFTFNDSDFKSIIDLVKKKTGIKLAENKRNMVYSRLARRLRELKFQSFEEYIDFIQSKNGENETGNFVNAITTNLTSFFRENHHFDHLKKHLQTLVKSQPLNKKIRIWSSASSSGQEPYSIAMTVHNSIPSIIKWDVKILATDIDTNMLKTCVAGEYKIDQKESIPPEYFKKYTVESMDSDTFIMSDIVKRMITYKQLNLLHEWPMKGPFDIIFCRNVVIYFDKPTQRELFNRIADLLRLGGLLYIGHSESLFNVSDRFESVGRTIYRRIK
jgi:chemotaxis protein methyltransferase CheR